MANEFNTNPGGIQPGSNITNQIVLLEQDDWDDETKVDVSKPQEVADDGTTSEGDAYKYQPLVNGSDIRLNRTFIDVMAWIGNAAMLKAITGPADIENGISFYGAIGGTTVIVFRNLTQDPDPEWTILGGTTQTIPDEVTIVNDGDLTSTSALTVADNLSSTTNVVQVDVDLAGTPALAEGVIQGSITITGTEKSDKDVTEIVKFSKSELSETKTTFTYFKTITSVTATGFGAGTVDLTSQDKAVSIKFKQKDDKMVSHLTAEITKGQKPNVYYGLTGNLFEASVTRDEALIFTVQYLGRRARLSTNLAGDTGTSARKSDISGLKLSKQDIVPGYRCEVTLDGIKMALTNLSVTINQNLANSDVIAGVTHQSAPPIREEKREITISGTILQSVQNDPSTLVEKNMTLPNIVATFRDDADASFPGEIRIKLDKGHIIVEPDPATAATGRIEEEITIRAFVDELGEPSDFSIEMDMPDFDQPRIYS